MSTHAIKHRYSDAVLFECDVPDAIASGLRTRYVLERAVEAKANLRFANLRFANLSSADLSSANLRFANLSFADLSSADLSFANLRFADLSSADLSFANLSSADLSFANLSSADLSFANLRFADLSSADLSFANLRLFKTDFFDVLLRAPNEIAGLRAALVAGRVDGSVYEGDCACLVGTIGKVRGVAYTDLGNGIEPNSSRPAEQWFMQFSKGDTPEKKDAVKLTVEWLDEFVGLAGSFAQAGGAA